MHKQPEVDKFGGKNIKGHNLQYVVFETILIRVTFLLQSNLLKYQKYKNLEKKKINKIKLAHLPYVL